jgi:hypothetical protein
MCMSFPRQPAQVLPWLFSSQPEHATRGRLLPRWIFLRLLGGIVISAFWPLLFQIRGLIGPDGILPVKDFLQAVTEQMDGKRLWFAPSLLWWHCGNHALTALCWIGLLAGVALVLNLWPRVSVFVALVCYMSFVAVAQDFSGYQSDGMLLEALFIAIFFTPAGLRPGLGAASPPSRASLFLLQWEWFHIYFESGMVKLLSGDPQWHNLTAMDGYYQNGPLPTWVGYYISHLPHGFHAGSALATLVMELAIVWMLFLPRRWRLACFFIVTPWEMAVILTANYTFLNYIVLALGFLLLDDRFLERFVPKRLQKLAPATMFATISVTDPPADAARRRLSLAHTFVAAIMLTWVFYATTVEMLNIPLGMTPLSRAPIVALEPFRIANRYGLFAVMTRGRYEIEFQGSNDGTTWTPYPFRYKPQALNVRPKIYAPWQPRLDWNLWFASLGDWRGYPIVPLTETRLLAGSPDVLGLFAGNPFRNAPPKYVRAVLYQYWFTTLAEKRATGDWWKRQLMGVYAPVITRRPNGTFAVIGAADELPEHD